MCLKQAEVYSATFSRVVFQADAARLRFRKEPRPGLLPDLARLPLICVPQPPEHMPNYKSQAKSQTSKYTGQEKAV
jgi:hypothetical protein